MRSLVALWYENLGPIPLEIQVINIALNAQGNSRLHPGHMHSILKVPKMLFQNFEKNGKMHVCRYCVDTDFRIFWDKEMTICDLQKNETANPYFYQ
jgi:hypothetical protein